MYAPRLSRAWRGLAKGIENLMRLIAFLAFILATVVVHADASSFTGKKLFEWCTSKPQSLGDVSCDIFITGFVQGAMLASGKDKSGEVCLPAGFTPAEARAVFVRTMREPRLNLFMEVDGGLALAATLGMTFRCPGWQKSN